MAMLLQNRTISMILTVPDVKELISPISHSVENLDQTSLIHKPPSIPIYHGSIIRIEQHRDEENISDLIVHVPNFHHTSLPTVTISTIQTTSKRETSFKRRAPICPIRNDRSPSSDRNRSHSQLTNTKRFAIGLRNLSQVLTTNCKSKQSTNISEITFVPVLPDVEVIREDFQTSTPTKKCTNKHQNLTSKFISPKILFIKRKCFKIKRKSSSSSTSSNSNEIQTDIEDNTIENSRTSINIKDSEIESKQTTPIELNQEVEQQSKTNVQIPTICVDSESSSGHRYFTISGFPTDLRTTTTNTHIEDPSKENLILPNDTQSSIYSSTEQMRHYDNQSDDAVYVVHPNGDTYSECYEVTYEFDPEFQQFLENKKEPVQLPEIENQSSIKSNPDLSQYQGLTPALTTWLPIFPNNYEQIQSNDQQAPIITKPRVQFHSLENIPETNDDQTTIHQPESISTLSSSNDDDQYLCLDEDYTVIIELLKHVLQIDPTTNEKSI